MHRTNAIRRYYRALTDAYGPLHWWPAKTRFEVIVGAFLTQNTAWRNVEHALANLRRAGALNLAGIRNIRLHDLETLVRPAGFFRQKAQRLKTFVDFLDQNYQGSLRRMFARPTQELRQELLALNGVGPETADSILLYAGKHPVFVVDNYARRILDRHGIMPFAAGYDEIRLVVEKSLAGTAPDSVATLNQAHALMVQVGKNNCRKRPTCQGCPLQRFLPHTDAELSS
jgi:endonuclease III related protein